MWSIGTDTGGTFTDIVAIDEEGEIRIGKVPSTPPRYERGVVEGIQSLGIPIAELRLLYHGTTVTTNALITKSGPPTGLVATKGFRDLLELRRHNRQELYDIMWDPPPPLVPRRHRLEVRERMNYAGEVLVPLDEEEARRVARIFRERGIEAVAVAFLNAHTNPAHERRMREILAEELPDVHVSISSEILPEPPEFERTATTVANAYLAPVASRYLGLLESAMAEIGYHGDILIMHSGGGILTADSARRVPARTVTSGPAAGAMAAAAIAGAIGRPNVISLDMGGTSADIAVIRDGKPRLTNQSMPEWGLPIRFPAIDLIAIGAGGGSIAWIDAGGYPKSGPQSAGASPGPAAYGMGGTEPTNTDANLVLGRLAADSFLGGRMTIYPELAYEAVRRRIAEPLRLDPVEAAAGIIRITNSNMAKALRLVTVQRGLDPRKFSLLAFGGAGPVHAVELARELQIPEVIVPPSPGVTSALGLLFVDLVHDFSRSLIVPVEAANPTQIEHLFREMEEAARAALRRDGVAEAQMETGRAIDFRYIGQVRAITLAMPPGPIDGEALRTAVGRFHQEYRREYRYATEEIPVEIAVLRVTGRGVTPKPAFRRHPPDGRTAAPRAWHEVYFDGRFQRTAVYDRAALTPGVRLSGPAIIEQFDSTTVLPPDAVAEVDEYLNLIIRAG